MSSDKLLPTMQVLVIDYRLTFPSGTATGIMIKGFHTPMGEKIAQYALGMALII